MTDTHTDWLTVEATPPQAKNDIRIEGRIASVLLTQGLEAIIDTCDVDIIAPHSWRASHGYAHSDSAGMMHRLILDPPADMEVDHVNHNGLDNRRSNLRIVAHRDNLQNRRGASSRSRTGIRGVGISRSGNNHPGYRARVHVNGKEHVKWFPLTAQGLRDAEKAVEAMRAELMPHSKEARTHD